MKKLLLILLVLFTLTGCVSLVSNQKIIERATELGMIQPEDCPELVVPERQALPHPIVPTFQTTDEDGTPIPITQRYLMSMVIQLFGTVEKFQFLVEIYEREYLNTDGRIMPDLTLEELKKLYQERLSSIERARANFDPEESETQTEGTTSSASPGDQLTIEEFEYLLQVWEELNMDYNIEGDLEPRAELLDLTQLVIEEREKAEAGE